MAERNYILYRQTTLGQSLTEALDEVVSQGQLTPSMALKVMAQYDQSVNHLLATKVKNKTNFKGHLHTYRFCDNVWTFILEKATFKSDADLIETGCVKIVACDAKERVSKHGDSR